MKLLLLSLSATAGLGFLFIRPTESKPVTVTLFLDSDCPVAQLYGQRLNRLISEYEAQGVTFQAQFPNRGESDAKIRGFFRNGGFSIPWTYDVSAKECKKFGLQMTPAVVVTSDGTVVYKGAIDDNKNVELVRANYLRDAVESALKGEKPKNAITTPFGCVIEPDQGTEIPAKVTYAEHVASILNEHCVNCHRPGSVAPFSLIGYENAKAKANMVAYSTREGTMPPFKAVAGFGSFHDENRLTPKQRTLLSNWAESGMPRGDAKKEPSAPTFSSQWSLGAPDQLLSPDREFKVHAEGNDIYRQFVIDPKLTETKWVNAMDVRPGNSRVVHHVIVYLDKTGAATRKEAENKDGQPGYSSFGGPGFIPAGSLGGWAPGMQARKSADGSAFRIDPGTKLVIQVHYHPTGKVETDQTEVGLYFAKEKVTKELDIAWLLDLGLNIPAGQDSVKVLRQFSVPGDGVIYSVMPHMHLLGKAMKAWIVSPEGDKKPLVWVDDWDFNWQMTYFLKEPMRVKQGAKILVEALYDNSESNINNPNQPPKRVTWGEETTDEMFLLVVAFSHADGKSRGTLFQNGRRVIESNLKQAPE